MFLFYYFLVSSLTGEKRKKPYCTDTFIGDINEFCSIDGVGYYIVDYAVEEVSWTNIM